MKFCKTVFLILVFSFPTLAQQVPKQDSVYQKIQKYATKTKFRKLVHKLVFRSIDNTKNNPVVLQKAISLATFEGKIIRKINIKALDPFGRNLQDSARKPRNWAERSGNKLHLKTKQIAIKNLILLKSKKPFDSLLVRESERLIRSQRFVNSVDIAVVDYPKSVDSVDVTITVLDSWSLIPTGSISDSRAKIGLNERNFMGIGHNVDNEVIRNFENGISAYDLNYIIPNFKNTFIRTAANYKSELNQNFIKSIAINRPFYSAYAKWAGGILVGQQLSRDSISDVIGNKVLQNSKRNFQDYWLGRSFNFLGNRSENERSTNFIVSARYFNQKYIERPSVQFDSVGYYSSEKNYLLSFGLASRQFVRDKYIFNYGIIEDVPIGKIIGFTFGVQNKNDQNKLYFGGRFSVGSYYKFGYLSGNLDVGSFFADNNSYQTALNFQVNYFTKRINFGNWKIRQFVKSQFVIGTHRLNFAPDLLTINNQNGLRGFDAPLLGTQKFVVTLQTQFFSPWNVVGFRINPFLDFGLAGLGTKINPIQKSKVYSKIGLGIAISNDYLVFKTFQFSVSYYPQIPFGGEHIFKTNAFQSTDFGFQDFDFGKPQQVLYR